MPTASQMIRDAIAKENPGYQGELRVGAVYRSRSLPHVSRRIQSILDGVVAYRFVDDRRCIHPECFMLEEMFRSVTLKEIPPEEL